MFSLFLTSFLLVGEASASRADSPANEIQVKMPSDPCGQSVFSEARLPAGESVEIRFVTEPTNVFWVNIIGGLDLDVTVVSGFETSVGDQPIFKPVEGDGTTWVLFNDRKGEMLNRVFVISVMNRSEDTAEFLLVSGLTGESFAAAINIRPCR